MVDSGLHYLEDMFGNDKADELAARGRALSSGDFAVWTELWQGIDSVISSYLVFVQKVQRTMLTILMAAIKSNGGPHKALFAPKLQSRPTTSQVPPDTDSNQNYETQLAHSITEIKSKQVKQCQNR